MSFDDACRCCLDSNMINAVPIVAIYENGTIADLIKTVTNIDVVNDENFPQQICNDCLEKLLAAEEIKKKFSESDMILRGLFSPKLEIKQEECSEMDHDLQEDQYGVSIIDKLDSEDNSFTVIETESILDTSKKKRKTKKITTHVCEICPRSFANHKKLMDHCREHRINDDPALYECTNCKFKLYTTKSIKHHKCGLKSTCYFCHEAFEGRKPLYRHMDENHRQNDHFVCVLNECLYKSSKVETMFYHLSSHFAPLEILCELCSMKFTNQEKYYRHRSMHNARKLYCCDVCGVRIWMKQNLIRHMQRSHMNKRYYCDQCPSAFTDGSVLKQHKVRNHGLDSQYHCEECDVKFVFLSQLTAHQKTHTSGRTFSKRVRRAKGQPPETGPFICEHCPKVFTLKANKRRHFETVHLGVKKFVCSYSNCNASFSQRTGLEVHYRLHTGEKPHHCSQCAFNCSDPSTLLKHLKNVHKVEKPTMKGECGIRKKN